MVGLRVAAVLSLAAIGCGRIGADPPAQTIVLRVPVRTDVVAPPNATVVHDLKADAQPFHRQSWSVTTNAPGGVTVQFSVDSPFVHRENRQVKVDAGLNLEMSQSIGPARWTVTRPNDETSLTTGDEAALVEVVSDAYGQATVGIQVFFLPTHPTLPQGQYTTTVSCTIATP